MLVLVHVLLKESSRKVNQTVGKIHCLFGSLLYS